MGISVPMADALLRAGHITPETHALVTGAAATAPPPVDVAALRAGMPGVVSVPDVAPAETPAAADALLPAEVTRGNTDNLPQMALNAAYRAGATPEGLQQQVRVAQAPGTQEFVGPPNPDVPSTQNPRLEAAPAAPAAAPSAPAAPASAAPPTGAGSMTIPETKITGAPSARAGGGGGAGGGAGSDPRAAAVEHEQAALDTQIDREAEAERLRAQRTAELADVEAQRRDALEQADVLAKARSAERERAIDDAASKRMQAIDEYHAATVDPDKDRSVSERISDAIAMALGGFVEGYTMGAVKNRAAELIQNRINQRIRAQEVELAKKKDLVGEATNSLAVQRQLAGDAKAGELAERVRLLGQYQDVTAATIAKYDSEAMRVNGQKTIDALEQQKIKLKDDLAMQLRAEEARRAAAAAVAAQQRDDKLFQRGVELKKLDNEGKRVDVEGRKADAEIAKAQGGTASRQEQIASFNADLKAFEMAWANAEKDLPGSRPGAWLGEKAATDANSRYQGAVAKLVSTVKGPGENSDVDAERLRSMGPQPGDDPETLRQKRAQMLASVYQKHPIASQLARERIASVPTTEAPGR